MAIPVAYALAFPDRLPLDHLKSLSLVECGEPHLRRARSGALPMFTPCLPGASSGRHDGRCLNAANEELVAALSGGEHALRRHPAPYRDRDDAPSQSARAHPGGSLSRSTDGLAPRRGADRRACREPLTCTPRAQLPCSALAPDARAAAASPPASDRHRRRSPRPTSSARVLARSHYENFTVASWLMPRAMRKHMHAIYAYARMADDFADEEHDPAQAR